MKGTMQALQTESTLQHEGILSRGFGIIPKIICQDTTLTLEAKALYGYLASFAGNGITAYPSRSKIMSDLRIGKSRYYAHFKLLTDADYIRVEQIKNNNQEYGQNTYMLVERPVGLQNKWGPEDTRADKLRLRGIRAGGYGIIPKACMMDQRLSIQSKGMFAYFCSITGGGDIEFPSVAKLRYFLQISDKSYAKYMKELVGCAYISIRQRWDGKFGTNEYFVNNGLPAESPDDDTAKIRKNRDTASSESGNEKTRKNEDTRNRDTEKT